MGRKLKLERDLERLILDVKTPIWTPRTVHRVNRNGTFNPRGIFLMGEGYEQIFLEGDESLIDYRAYKNHIGKLCIFSSARETIISSIKKLTPSEFVDYLQKLPGGYMDEVRTNVGRALSK